MIIDTLKLRDFRNYQTLTLTPHPGINLLFGQNGSGKTNLLEAIHYCALGRSHRTSLDREVVRKGLSMAACGVTLSRGDGRCDVAVKITPNEARKKQVFLDGKRASRLSDMMGRLQCVIFSPEDLMLIKEGPALRRRFLDMMLSQLSTGYFIALQQYQKALEQRNAILRDAKKGGRIDHAMLDAFEDAMSQPAGVIIPARSRILMRLADLSEKKYLSISGREHEQLRLKYLCCMKDEDNVIEAFRKQMQISRREDMFRGVTGFGLHREDVGMELNGREMKVFASQGQIRTAALSLKLAQMDVFRMESGEAPILLLDDVMSELDMTRRTRLLDEIAQVQTFVTCTDRSDLQGCKNLRSYQVTLDENICASIHETNAGEVVFSQHENLDDFDFQ